ncbi:glycoside hydrolase family 9 protein [Actinosynnema sp. NPDC023587]|uniref:glycoside hydrolase family 9 protein n=1 Tax=Actinosynnema sp. NPDC023587 TaxID=3154695 RepID=UPI00340EBB4A
MTGPVGGYSPQVIREVSLLEATAAGRPDRAVRPGRGGRATSPSFKVGDGLFAPVAAGPLKPAGPTVDVEGGWFDAGDFVKFTHASAYATASLLSAQRDRENPAPAAETRFGLRWLDKVWDADELSVEPGDEKYFIKHRPVFRANEPGEEISPNLVRSHLQQAASLFAPAETTDVGELASAFPHAYHPEDSWADDLAFGATQLAPAGRALRDSRSAGWAKAATHWATTTWSSCCARASRARR